MSPSPEFAPIEFNSRSVIGLGACALGVFLFGEAMENRAACPDVNDIVSIRVEQADQLKPMLPDLEVKEGVIQGDQIIGCGTKDYEDLPNTELEETLDGWYLRPTGENQIISNDEEPDNQAAGITNG